MGIANIDALIASIAEIKEQIRWREASLANTNPNFKANQAYIARLNSELIALRETLTNEQSQLDAASNATKIVPSRANLETSINVQTPFDDDGNLNPGWRINEETGEPYFAGTTPPATTATNPSEDPSVRDSQTTEQITSPNNITENVFDPRQEVTENVFDPRQEVTENVFDPNAVPQGVINRTRSTATREDAVSFEKAKDWRVRLSLAPNAKYLYNADPPGILEPLQATNGVVFPYTPSVSVAYNAAYEASDLIHSNYKIYNYKNSSVDSVTIGCDFTAQDTTEATYLLATIHFFRSVTKMFYGRDENPRNGVPPPLCYLSGLGTFQFDNHPLVITNFTYTLPTDVDYIRAGSMTNEPGSNTGQQTSPTNTDSASNSRILTSGLMPKRPNFQRQSATINSSATYVPTKMNISITCIPIVTRNDISNNFSLKDYATGSLLQGSKRNGGGIW
jgi:hypothetical protein